MRSGQTAAAEVDCSLCHAHLHPQSNRDWFVPDMAMNVLSKKCRTQFAARQQSGVYSAHFLPRFVNRVSAQHRGGRLPPEMWREQSTIPCLALRLRRALALLSRLFVSFMYMRSKLRSSACAVSWAFLSRAVHCRVYMLAFLPQTMSGKSLLAVPQLRPIRLLRLSQAVTLQMINKALWCWGVCSGSA